MTDMHDTVMLWIYFLDIYIYKTTESIKKHDKYRNFSNILDQALWVLKNYKCWKLGTEPTNKEGLPHQEKLFLTKDDKREIRR